MDKMINAGKYNRRIIIYQIVQGTDSDGFPSSTENIVLTTYAAVKTLRGYTLITNNSNFDKAYINFTIRYPHQVTITRDMLLKYGGKTYTIEYLNDIDFAHIELEIQAKEVTK